MIDPTINDYLNGKIYKLVSSQTNDIYIGSTKNTLEKRFTAHQFDYNMYDEKRDKPKRLYRKAFEILKYDDVKIVLIETYPTSSRFFLELREGRLILDMDCINDVIPRNKYQHLDPCKIIDPTIDDYLHGKIYKLVSNQTNDIYIGSTKSSLATRFACHKYSYKKGERITASHLLQYDDVRIELLEDYPTTSQYFLHLRERYWIQELKCVNFILPTRTKQEYEEDRAVNKEQLNNNEEDNSTKPLLQRRTKQEYGKEYREINKERLKKYREDNSAVAKQYKDAHKTETKEYNRQYNKNNKTKIKESNQQYNKNNKTKRKEVNKQYKDNHKTEIKEYNKKYREDNKEQISEQRRLAAQQKKELGIKNKRNK